MRVVRPVRLELTTPDLEGLVRPIKQAAISKVPTSDPSVRPMRPAVTSDSTAGQDRRRVSGMDVGDIITLDAVWLTGEQAERAIAAAHLRAWFAEHEPSRPLTTTERDAIVYHNQWPVRNYEVTGEIKMDVLHGYSIPIKPCAPR